ncbi:MAG: hypothetical protein FJX34_01810 [Alphaproteobacteria bacterium]|nr:hypothetical protein [Alphaproteobacteria bacterium]
MILAILALSSLLIAAKFLVAKSFLEKIVSFYLLFTILIVTILASAVASFDSLLDIIILLFLIKLTAVLFIINNERNQK